MLFAAFYNLLPFSGRLVIDPQESFRDRVVSFLLYGLLNKMKLLKTVPAALMLAGGVFAAMNATADDTVFTVMDDPSTAKKPFEGNLNAGYWHNPVTRKALL
jgi:putative salt-induced outer membrane protein